MAKIEYIELGGVMRPVCFGMNSMDEFSALRASRQIKEHGCPFPVKPSIHDYMLLVWCGLKHGARIEGMPFSATLLDVGDWLDDSPQCVNIIRPLINEFLDKMQINRTEELQMN